MRYTFIFSLILLLSQIEVLSQENTSHKYCDSSGCVGDVKYSVLEPNVFLTINGNGWRLMDGQNIKGTPLSVLLSIDTLPDARGMFIRGINEKRKDGLQNPDNKNVGEVQHDALIAHTHSFEWAQIDLQRGADLTGTTFASKDYNKIRYTDNEIRTLTDGARNTGNTNNNNEPRPAKIEVSSETRPRNISLFIYIKVDLNTK